MFSRASGQWNLPNGWARRVPDGFAGCWITHHQSSVLDRDGTYKRSHTAQNAHSNGTRFTIISKPKPSSLLSYSNIASFWFVTQNPRNSACATTLMKDFENILLEFKFFWPIFCGAEEAQRTLSHDAQVRKCPSYSGVHSVQIRGRLLIHRHRVDQNRRRCSMV